MYSYYLVVVAYKLGGKLYTLGNVCIAKSPDEAILTTTDSLSEDCVVLHTSSRELDLAMMVNRLAAANIVADGSFAE